MTPAARPIPGGSVGRRLRLRVSAIAGLVVFLAMAGAFSTPRSAAADASIAWRPMAPRVGDVAMVEVSSAGAAATVTGTLGRRPLVFAPHGSRYIAVLGFDVDMPSGMHDWRVEIREAGGEARAVTGRLSVAPRTFDVQHLTLPRGMVDLDPQTERRANAESARLRALYRTFTPERLWRDAFVRPLVGPGPGTGFGARRIINGQPRAPHTGADYAAPAGSPVLAANAGRVALVDEFFFPGRLVVIDHGLGLYTLYFHLEAVGVSAGQAVERGQSIGTVGATGRATGPHLHFGAQVGEARVDPISLLAIGGLDVGPLDVSPEVPSVLGTRLAPR